ncbi:PLDc_N domain-containing protein [Methanohalophilus sp. RSK]|uniref:PLDc N-terminal domain-containing protein n=1 Tax=Methanohalophilus sp. RSK TaxID=2485783 RepID=UPI000F43BC97|nr:PLD nuclease N-terminal domain-containing protein [Methanohalophilus sp. RSK]RNI12071.1 PLDc_N domain-containing protein [Methanohalophilus sp. RSK]
MFDWIALPFFNVILFLGIGLLGTAFWIWMLIDCITKETDRSNERLIWVIVIVFTHLLGAILYFILRKNRRNR